MLTRPTARLVETSPPPVQTEKRAKGDHHQPEGDLQGNRHLQGPADGGPRKSRWARQGLAWAAPSAEEAERRALLEGVQGLRGERHG